MQLQVEAGQFRLGLVRRLHAPVISQPAAMGALPTLRAATDPAALGGQCYGPGGRNAIMGHPRLVTSSPASYEVAVQQRLWAVSEDLAGVAFPVGAPIRS